MTRTKLEREKFIENQLLLIKTNQNVLSINITKPTGILSPEFVFLSFPYKDPKIHLWSKFDEKKQISLNINSGVYTDAIKNQVVGPYVGIPFGSYARLILMHIISEAKIKNTQIIDFGKSINEMIVILGLNKKKKIGGTQKKALQEQWLRVSKCYISFNKEEENHPYKANASMNKIMLATNIKFWSKDENTQRYTIRISNEFFEYIKSNANIPYKKELIPQFLETPMLIDLYLLFNHSAYWANRNKQDKFIPFRYLYNNFGSQGQFKSFKQSVKKNIIKLSKILSGVLFVEFGEKNNEDGVIILKQSQSNVRFDNQEYVLLNCTESN